MDKIILASGQQWAAPNMVVTILDVCSDQRVWFSTNQHPQQSLDSKTLIEWLRAVKAELKPMIDLAALEIYHERLRGAFGKVCNSENWKYRIDATVAAEDLALTINAIAFMTGGKTEVTALANGQFQITSPGYYAVVGA